MLPGNTKYPLKNGNSIRIRSYSGPDFSAFSHIWTEYGGDTEYSVRMREKC